MTEKLNVTVKRESDTRWSARESAVRVIAQSYDDIIALLQEMNEDAMESADTREKAGTLLNSLLTLSFVCFLLLWEQVLHKINVVQKRLQSPKMNLRTVSECYRQWIKGGCRVGHTNRNTHQAKKEIAWREGN